MGARRWWPRSLFGQMLLGVAAALLLGQAISAVLLYRAAEQRREAAIVNSLAFRILAPERPDGDRAAGIRRPGARIGRAARRRFRLERSERPPSLAGDRGEPAIERALAETLAAQGFADAAPQVVSRSPRADPRAARWIARGRWRGGRPGRDDRLLLATWRAADGAFVTARAYVVPADTGTLRGLLAQTALLFVLLLGFVAWLLLRITRPLAALTAQVERFARTREAGEQIDAEGPEDVRRLIDAHNALEARITALLDEKDVMLGAIGHDLKTPLAALRVRIESVSDAGERARMAAGIDDIACSLDDILSLARVGRPTDPLERTELAALTAGVVDEYEDMGDPVELGETVRVALPLRATWVRRALRNLIGNALRYAGGAQVSLRRDGTMAVLRVEDDGPGIADERLADMLEPFVRGEASRNRDTGGAGLGLTLARAIAQQHGGQLVIANRRDAGGAVVGLAAELSLPLA